MLYGLNAVEAALISRNRTLERLYLKEGRLTPRLAAVGTLAGEAGVGISSVSPADLDKTCGSDSHQGCALVCGPLPTRGEQDCLALIRNPPRKDRFPLLLALDEVQDPMNLGAIARSAAAFGVDGLVLPRDHSSPLSPAASRASAGFLESMAVFEVPNLARFLAQARKAGFWVAGSVLEGGDPLVRFSHDQPLILVMGSEGRGLRHLIRNSCDFLLTINTTGGGGLNVSAATAVFLYHLTTGKPD